MVDFSKKLKNRLVSIPKDPKQIYLELDRTAGAGPLRPVQESVLEDWYNNHFNDRDVIIKLHTGEGKTLIGLLALQSRLNSGEGPCLYVCPSQYLASQVANDAVKFGIKYILHEPGTDIPIDFTEGKVILITYIQRLFNGRTQFGIDNKHIATIGTIVLDDSHACIESIRSSYSVKAKKRSPLYQRMINLFEPSLRKQGEGSFLDIKDKDNGGVLMLLPYWDWIDKKQEVSELMSQHQDDEELKFVYPLLKDSWEHCSVYFTGLGLEIIPDYSLISRFTAYTTAKQRIAMSATTQNDSFFIKGLGFSKNAILNPLINKTSKWAGEKMILFPTRMDEALNNELMRTWAAHTSKEKNISKVILVPSNWWADDYFKKGAHVAQKEKLKEEILYLQNGSYYDHSVVFVNRYDGIDLPDSQCRILILDSLPMFVNLSDRYEHDCRENSDLIVTKIAQKIEQGLGRSVRSEKDYSIILILGEDLIRFIKTSNNQRYFSSQTKKQIEIGEEVTLSVKDEIGEKISPQQAFTQIVNQCLTRDEGWKQFYQQCMDEIEVTKEEHSLIDLIEQEYNAEIAYSKRNYHEAGDIYQRIANSCNEDLEKGWYLQLVAKCTYHNRKLEAERIQKKAHELNSYLLMPENFHYKPIGEINRTSLGMTYNYISKFHNYNDLLYATDELLGNLTFGVSSNKFEAALKELGTLLGFFSERPDQNYKVGPDNLWMSPHDRHFMLFECKNEIQLTRESINKEEVGQMNNHIGWFESNYGKDTIVKYVHVHPTNVISPKADYNKDVYVLVPEKLELLKNNVKSFIKEFDKYLLKSLDEKVINDALIKHHLILNDLETKYFILAKKEGK